MYILKDVFRKECGNTTVVLIRLLDYLTISVKKVGKNQFSAI